MAAADGARTVRDCASGTLKAGRCGGAKQRRDCCGTLGGNKPRGSTGGHPRFGVCNGMHLALAICGAICTRQHSAVGGGAPGPSANVRGASRFRPRENVGGVSPRIMLQG